jgi:uncharacterized protein YbjT (DUF2867 family)
MPATPQTLNIQLGNRLRIIVRVNIFVAGGTGYIGRPLIQLLLQDGHTVRGLARPGSEDRLPAGCTPVIGNALDAASYQSCVAPSDTFVHLVGVAHPGPGKGQQFRDIDLKSIESAVTAAKLAGIRHFVYVSVAHPAPIMQDYIAVRTRGEDLIREAGFNATILRPWYVLGPGHWWPYALLPVYWMMEAIPSTRESARRLGLVSHAEMVGALRRAVLEPATGISIVNVGEIRRLAHSQAA